MKYNLNSIQARFSEKEALKYVFFWGHQPSKDGSITKTCLSQWWECAFEVDGLLYNSAEQYMMAEKAKLFGDAGVREKILQAKHPKQIKDLGRCVSGFDEDIWQENRYGIVITGNHAKFYKMRI
jgi:hypothetical protein